MEGKNNDCINFMLINCITLLLYYFRVLRFPFTFCTMVLTASAFFVVLVLCSMFTIKHVVILSI